MKAVIVAIFCVLAAGPVTAKDFSPELIERVKAATAYLETADGNLSGSAFCVSPQGIFFTCAHVLGDAKIGTPVRLVLEAGTPRAEAVNGEVIRWIADLDMAAIRIDKEMEAFLPIGDSEKLMETDPVLAAGYPFGRALELDEQAPAITITSGEVTALRRTGGHVDRLQIDAELNPGNSGGPVVDRDGRVVGMAASVIGFTRIRFAIGTHLLRALSEMPLMRFENPEPIAAGDLSEPLEVSLALEFLGSPETDPKVSAALVDGGGEERPMTVRRTEDGDYRLTGVPAPDGNLAARRLFRVEFVRQVGNTRHTQRVGMADQMIEVGGEPVRLSRLRAIMPAAGRCRTAVGELLEGPIDGLETLRRRDARGERPFNGSGYDLILVRPESAEPGTLELKVRVTSGPYTKTVRLPLKVEAPSAAVSGEGDPRIEPFRYKRGGPEFDGPGIDIDPGGEIHEAAWGGGGRYLVLKLKRELRIVVIDAVSGKITAEIPLEDPEAVLAAGGREFFIARGGRVSRRALEDGSRRSEAATWAFREVVALASAPTWTRRVGVLSALAPGDPDRRFELCDARTGEILAIEPGGMSLRGMSMVRAAWNRPYFKLSEAGVHARDLEFHSGKLFKASRGTRRLPMVDAGGAWELGFRGDFAPLAKPEWTQGGNGTSPLIPTSIPGLAVKFRPGISGAESSAAELDLIDLDLGRRLVAGLVELEEFGDERLHEWDRGERLLPDKRCLLVPQLGRLITIGGNRRQVRVRKFDLWRRLGEEDIRFVFVTSPFPDLIPAGQTFRWKLEAASSSPDAVRFELLAGPEGLELAESGEMTWSDPVAGADEMVVVRVVGDGAGERLWKRFVSVR